MMRLAAACALVLGLWVPDGGDGLAEPSDFERDLAALDVAIAAASSAASGPATAAERAVAIAELAERRASLTGDAASLEQASAALEAALQFAGPVEELLLLDAELKLKTHRVREAEQTLAAIADPVDVERAMLLHADISVQDGDYPRARRVYASLVESNPTWDRIARLAYLELMLGDPDRADELYVKAEEQLTAKEMRQFAWLELQRGLLEFRRGRFEPALTHYQRADRAYSGYWMTQDYMAELLAAKGGSQLRHASALYERLLARSAQPQIEQALGDVYALQGKAAQASVHHERALATYLESARRGQTQYFHHLAGYYADVVMDGPEAVRWARKDLEMRAGYASHDALAWALFRGGDIERARQEMDLALIPGLRDAHVLFHAAMINLAAGRAAEGRRLLREAGAINPQYGNFHVHR